MNAKVDVNDSVARIAAAIGEPARARMLYCLLDNRARTSTELAMVADVNPSTASAHLSKLKAEGLVRVAVQGKHRYYSLPGSDVADVLEKLSVLAGAAATPFVATTPDRLRSARTCYDHIAGSLGVSLHDTFRSRGWIRSGIGADDSYDLSTEGESAFRTLGIDVAATRLLRRRFAFQCLDWSERRPHLGGALAAAVLGLALSKKWVAHERDSRVLRVTASGSRELRSRLGIDA